MTKIENPVLPGFNPDPSFVRVGSDYYIATSTFEWFPGICIHHSTDLMNWEIISYALDDDSKFNIMGIDTSCGIWAPNLTYDHGTFYLVYTIVYTNRHRYKDTHNFLIMSNSVTGPWSDPISLNRAGFDPSIFHDPDGKKWLVNMLFDYRLDHKRFAGVGIQEYHPITKKLIGLEYNIFTGSGVGTTEGPNIFYYGGYYYLVTAEGGTAFDHCVTMCRAKNITGPYELCPDNPVLTSKGKEDALLKRAGHGQIIQAEGGNWFIAHLCSRTVDDCSILGRETAIQNMDYTADGWFRIHANEDASPESYFEVPEEVEKAGSKDGFVNFAKNKVPYDYMTLRQSREKNGIRLVDGKLEMTGGNSLASKYNQCFLARRQQHFSYDFTAAIEFEPTTYRHMAGIACYYNYD
ncbi:MAG: family 43 glycosylhydrolase, partial [Hungatella sp.]